MSEAEGEQRTSEQSQADEARANANDLFAQANEAAQEADRLERAAIGEDAGHGVAGQHDGLGDNSNRDGAAATDEASSSNDASGSY